MLLLKIAEGVIIALFIFLTYFFFKKYKNLYALRELENERLGTILAHTRLFYFLGEMSDKDTPLVLCQTKMHLHLLFVMELKIALLRGDDFPSLVKWWYAITEKVESLPESHNAWKQMWQLDLNDFIKNNQESLTEEAGIWYTFSSSKKEREEIEGYLSEMVKLYSSPMNPVYDARHLRDFCRSLSWIHPHLKKVE